MNNAELPAPVEAASSTPFEGHGRAPLVKRHRLSTRVWHWTNAVTVFVMLMSGLMIFNAHPRLYWGQYGANADPAWLAIGSDRSGGFVDVAGLRATTTGLLGQWQDGQGQVQRRAFPGWATIPSYYSLSGARRWHLGFAWILSLSLILYLLWSLWNRHIRTDILPTRAELQPSHLWQDIADHARLRHPTGPASLRYNVLQKLSYVGVLFLLLPLMILTGLAMSPAMDAAWPWLIDVFGGRQSARSIHFIVASLILLFILIHLVEAALAGPINELRSMITGWYRPRPERVRQSPSERLG